MIFDKFVDCIIHVSNLSKVGAPPTFSGGIEMRHWAKMTYINPIYRKNLAKSGCKLNKSSS